MTLTSTEHAQTDYLDQNDSTNGQQCQSNMDTDSLSKYYLNGKDDNGGNYSTPRGGHYGNPTNYNQFLTSVDGRMFESAESNGSFNADSPDIKPNISGEWNGILGNKRHDIHQDEQQSQSKRLRYTDNEDSDNSQSQCASPSVSKSLNIIQSCYVDAVSDERVMVPCKSEISDSTVWQE